MWEVSITESRDVAGIDRNDVEGSRAASVIEAADAVEPCHFRIYPGAAAGAGKTCAMLNEAQRRRGRGADVVVGFVECHGRRLTEVLIGDLEVIPPVP
jgi:K+-sensing histidine kinase KdpD